MKKATTFNNIPGKFLKDYAESYSKTITGLVNESIETFNFSDKLKLADIHPIHKKKSLETLQKIIGQSVYYLMHQNCMSVF